MMMKRFSRCFLFVILFMIIIDVQSVRKTKIISIASGTSFGMCLGYCRRSINILFNETKLIAFKETNRLQNDYPFVQKSYPFSSNQCQQLMKRVNFKRFRTLEETIGCPDCADGGAEWIEIKWLNTTKRVTFENGHSIQGLDKFIKQLRQLRDQYVDHL